MSFKGGGVTVEPFETRNGNVEVVVNPEAYSTGFTSNTPFTLSTIIVHEFGHAFANRLGYFGTKHKAWDLFHIGPETADSSWITNDPLFFELAVMMENQYRLQKGEKWLRGWHGPLSDMPVPEE